MEEGQQSPSLLNMEYFVMKGLPTANHGWDRIDVVAQWHYAHGQDILLFPGGGAQAAVFVCGSMVLMAP